MQTEAYSDIIPPELNPILELTKPRTHPWRNHSFQEDAWSAWREHKDVVSSTLRTIYTTVNSVRRAIGNAIQML